MASQPNVDLSRSQAGGSGPASSASSRSEGATSKPSTPVDSIDFRFLNFSHPKDAKNATTRRNVRSHVTGVQHARQRQAAAEQAKRTQSSSSGVPPTPILAGPSPSYSASYAGSPALSENDTSSPEEPSGASPATSSVSPPASPLPRLNPLEVYPEEWHPYLRPVIDHYLENMSIDLPETDRASRELLRTSFMDVVLSDRASVHALLLVAGAHWNKVRPQQQHRINLLQLRGMAIQEINQALGDHRNGGRATSDQLLAAVGKMATYELLFGQRETFHTHMTGLQRMVSLRGGLQALGLHGLLERILLWIDSNAMVITKTSSLYFPPAAFSSTSGHPQPNQRLFLLGLQAGSRNN
ncbi:Hypothetical predicted protein [Lecanosticta acicola]|uniref:Uncharacterized protein n=1 Tax=Lecanosticta acicola TaxID=111012 RepID=A0AAI9E827_9PEZI|nr:Hypothetical predicted protein [Lecanosticta acicola]